METIKGLYQSKRTNEVVRARPINLMVETDLSDSAIHNGVLIEKVDQKTLCLTEDPIKNQFVASQLFFEKNYFGPVAVKLFTFEDFFGC